MSELDPVQQEILDMLHDVPQDKKPDVAEAFEDYSQHVSRLKRDIDRARVIFRDKLREILGQ